MAQLLQVNSKDLKESLLKIKPGQTLNAETILAARELLLAAMNKMDELAVAAKSGGPDDLMAFRQHMALTSELQKIIKGVQTETGRALQQFKIPVRDKAFTARNLDDLNRDQLIMDLGGEGAIRNLANIYLKANTAKARATLTDKAGFITKTQDALAEIFINAILSNPLTHVRNTAGNWINQGIMMQERKIASRFLVILLKLVELQSLKILQKLMVNLKLLLKCGLLLVENYQKAKCLQSKINLVDLKLK